MNKKERVKIRGLDDSKDEYTYTVFKLERVLSRERTGFIYYGYIDGDFMNRTYNEPYTLTKDYVHIINWENYTSKEEAERSLNDFLSGKEKWKLKGSE